MCKIAILDKTVGEAPHCDVVKDDPFLLNTCDVSSYLYKTNLIYSRYILASTQPRRTGLS